MIHVPTQCGVILNLQGELYRRNQCRRWHIAEGVLGHPADVHHERDTAPGPDINRRAATGDSGQGIAHRVRKSYGVFGDTRPQRSSCAYREGLCSRKIPGAMKSEAWIRITPPPDQFSPPETVGVF